MVLIVLMGAVFLMVLGCSSNGSKGAEVLMVLGGSSNGSNCSEGAVVLMVLKGLKGL